MAGILTAVGIGLAVAGSTAQIISGETKRVRAKRALEGFQRQELKNITKNLRVSTLGAELQTQEAQRRFATSVDALRSGGVRGVVGGLGQQEAQQQNLQQQISADLDRQQIQIDRLAAEDDIRIREMIELRESGQIAGLGAEMAAGSRTVQAGIGGLASAGIAGARIAGMGGFDGLKKGVEGAKLVDLTTGGKAGSDLISSQPTRFMETPSGTQDLSKTFGFTRDIGAALLSPEVQGLGNTAVNVNSSGYEYGLKPRR